LAVPVLEQAMETSAQTISCAARLKTVAMIRWDRTRKSSIRKNLIRCGNKSSAAELISSARFFRR
jgi:hypothetical protein